MQVILLKDFENLGSKNDLVEVKGGYARNYLIPKKIVVIANSTNKKVRLENIKQANAKLQKIKENALSIAKAIGAGNLVVQMRASENGKIFGSVTPIQIAEKLKLKGFHMDRKVIKVPKGITNLGKYEIQLHLHKEVIHPIQIEVVEEK